MHVHWHKKLHFLDAYLPQITLSEFLLKTYCARMLTTKTNINAKSVYTFIFSVTAHFRDF